MKSLKSGFIEIFRQERSVVYFMVGNFLASLIFFATGIFSINYEAAVVKIGYGDISGYVDGSYTEMIAFPLMAVIFGVVHNLLAIRVYEKYGGDIAKVFLVMSMLLIAGGMVVLLRLLGEG